MDNEVQNCISSASASGRLRKRVYINKDLRIHTKVAVYQAICVSTLLYGCEAWTLYHRLIQQLESFHIKCLQCILGLTWRDRVPHTEVLSRTGTKSMEAYSFSTNCDGLVTSSGCQRTGFHASCCTVSYITANALQEVKCGDTRTNSRLHSRDVEYSTRSLKALPQTVLYGGSSAILDFSALKRRGVGRGRGNARGER